MCGRTPVRNVIGAVIVATKKPKKPKKAKKPPKPKKPKMVHARHPAAILGKSTASSDEPKGLTASGGSVVRDLSASVGLSSVLLDLVGESPQALHQGLVAWQREQDRVSNRAWRRPGGMARMGNL